MNLLFKNLGYEKIILLKKKIHKVIKLIMGKDDDPFDNFCLIL